MVESWAWLALQAGLFAALGAVVVRGLKFLQKLDGFRPPVGARRVGAAFGFGDSFPTDRLPTDLASRVASGTAVFLFAGPGCCVCGPVLSNLPFLAIDNPSIQFVLLSLEPWDPFDGRNKQVRRVADVPLIETLGLMIQPYAIKTVDGRFAEFGVVNNIEHLESVLESAGRTTKAAGGAR